MLKSFFISSTKVEAREISWEHCSKSSTKRDQGQSIRELPKTYKHTLIILSLFSHYSLMFLPFFTQVNLTKLVLQVVIVYYGLLV